MKIVCMGDSITRGAFLENSTQRWSDLIEKQTGIQMINLGYGGDTTDGMLVRCHTQAFPMKADAMILLGGTNDICYAWEYCHAWSNMITMIRHARYEDLPVIIGIPIPIVAQSLSKRSYYPDRDNERIAALCDEFATRLKAYCQEKEISYVDFRAPFLTQDGAVRRELFIDGLHPNAEGHQLMAGELYKLLKELYPNE